MANLKQSFNAKLFAADILAKREKQNITYAKACTEMGMSTSILHRAESGLPVSLESFATICNWLGKKAQTYFVLILLFALPLVGSAQGKSKDLVTVDLSQAAQNPVYIILTDTKTGQQFTVDSYAPVKELKLPKKGIFTVRLWMKSNEDFEVSYSIGFLGMTLQPGQNFWVETYGIEFNSVDSITLQRM